MDPARGDELASRLRGWAADFGWSDDAWEVRTELRQEREEAEAWKRHWPPFRCAGFEILAPFHDPAEVAHRPGCTRLILEIGSAFGTGNHPTTRLALRGMRRALDERPVPRLLDVGTGTGILAVAAALLGVDEVAGMDPDPQSAPQARRMAARNGVAGRCRFWQGRFSSTPGTWPLVVANLVADLHIDGAAPLAALVEPGGRLLAGGVRADRLEATLAAFEDAGLTRVGVYGRGRWKMIQLCCAASQATA